VIGIAVLIYCGYIVEILVMHIWHKAPHGEHSEEGLTKEDKLYKEMIEGVEKDHSGAAYKDINGIYKLYDFHKTERSAVLDSQNLCVSCHGDIPHDKKKEIRAFLNMHAFFMACETCHIRSENKLDTKFVWYDKRTGEEKETIDLSLYLGDTPYKLMPTSISGPEHRFYDTEQMKKYVTEFKSKVGEMIPSAKSASLKIIHRPMSELEKTVKCDDCHKSDYQTAYLPFRKIGYPDRRMNQLVGNEVVGMIDKYKKFYLPDFLIPKEETESEN
jgi:hypothetical protein